MKKKDQQDRGNARALCQIAVATALICVCSWIALPFGSIPFTLQTFAVCLFSALLGAKKSFVAILAYLLLGFVGVPVFTGFTGGISKLFSPTGGYLIGFLLAAPLIGLFAQKSRKVKGRYGMTALGMALGTLVCYACGTAWLMLLSIGNTPPSLCAALSVCLLPYLPSDALKIALALIFVKRLEKIVINNGER